MTVVIGLAPDERGAAAAHLGSMLARSLSDDVVVATVVPTPWPPNPYRIDSEYLALREQAAQDVLAAARSQIGADLSVEVVLRHAGSIASGLLEIARERNATLVALGSASGGGLGVVSLGGVADRLLHSSDIPVTLAPLGFDTGDVFAKVKRVTVAYGRADRHSDLLQSVAGLASDIGASLRVACFAVRPQTAGTGFVEVGADDLVVAEWAEQIAGEIRQKLAAVESGFASEAVEIAVGRGGSWSEATHGVEWADGDLVAVGASSSAISRFFLGSHASKIVRSAPVPVYLMPRTLS